MDLAFFIIQRTTDLFGAEFPDFTTVASGMLSSEHSLAAPPTLVRCTEEARNYGRFIVKFVKSLRVKNVRQIAVVCHAETYWTELVDEFEKSQLPLHVIHSAGSASAQTSPL